MDIRTTKKIKIMENKLKIKSEIKRLKEKGYPIDTFEGSAGYYDALDEVLNFIDSLPEEPVSEDLEEAARRYAALQAGMKDAMTLYYYEEYPYSPNDIEAFKAGTQWQKEQMTNSAKKSKIVITSGGILLSDLKIEDFDYADKVKLIIIKENNK